MPQTPPKPVIEKRDVLLPRHTVLKQTFHWADLEPLTQHDPSAAEELVAVVRSLRKQDLKS
jgi:hypothetical protein